jgi:hypothetical protein
MIVWRFLKEQNWKYGIPCIIFLLLFESTYDLYYFFYLLSRISYIVFLLFYISKFLNKEKKDTVDIIRLLLFVSFLIFLLAIHWNWLSGYKYAYQCIFYSIPIVILISYFYSLLFLFYSENKKINMSKFSLYIIFIQTVAIVLLAVNCILLKNETEAQMVRSKEALASSKRTEEKAILAMKEALKNKDLAIDAQMETAKYKQLYEEALKQKK